MEDNLKKTLKKEDDLKQKQKQNGRGPVQSRQPDQHNNQQYWHN
jgi:hypothetical protein